MLGRRLVRGFVGAGHEVRGLVRSDQGDSTVRALGGTPVRADPLDAAQLAQAAKGCEVVVRAATAIPKSMRLRAADFGKTALLREEGTKALLAAAARAKARVYLQESIVWVARPPDGAPFDEESPVHHDAVMDSVIEAEHLAESMGASGELVTTTLRLGNFFAPDAWHTRFIGERLARHKLPLIGGGAAALSIIHADDAASAFVAAAARPRSGLYHVVDDEPASVREVLGALAHAIGARPPGKVPAWLARLAVGGYTTEFFRIPMRTSNARFRAAFGWAPRYPTYRETVAQIAAAWKEEGFPAGKGAA